jgi:hypothetical protein
VALSDVEAVNGHQSIVEAQMTHEDETETPPRPSLYDRLGGVYNIAPVVDDLIDRIMVDPRLNEGTDLRPHGLCPSLQMR